MALFLAPIINDQQENANGAPLSGGTIEVYLAGSSTPATTYFAQAGGVGNQNTWPIVLNTLGVNAQGAVWLTGGAAYKYVIKNSAGVVQRTIDNVSGINDNTVVADQWIVYQAAPTYVSATSFTVAGDQTQIFQINRRVKTTNTGGTIYSTITNSVYSSPNTTVTVKNDSGVLDSGLSQVSYGILSIQNSSVIGLLLNTLVLTANATYTPVAGAKSARFRAIAPGGAGGGVFGTGPGQSAAGGGGAAGNSAEFLITTLPASISITIGAAGVGASAAAGGNGGDIVVGSYATIKGGVGGGSGGALGGFPNYGGNGGSPAASTFSGVTQIFNGLGQAGGRAVLFAAGVFASGVGGSTSYGCGGNPTFASGQGHGAGGQGAGIGASASAAAGNGGSGGILIIEEYA